MTYVIAAPCIDVKDRACVDICPCDCIFEGADQLFIDPDLCIDCGACEPECPVDAIFDEHELPEQWEAYTRINADFFKDRRGTALKPALGSSAFRAGVR